MVDSTSPTMEPPYPALFFFLIYFPVKLPKFRSNIARRQYYISTTFLSFFSLSASPCAFHPDRESGTTYSCCYLSIVFFFLLLLSFFILLSYAILHVTINYVKIQMSFILSLSLTLSLCLSRTTHAYNFLLK